VRRGVKKPDVLEKALKTLRQSQTQSSGVGGINFQIFGKGKVLSSLMSVLIFETYP